MMTKIGDMGKIRAISRKTMSDHAANDHLPGYLVRSREANAAVISDPRLKDIIAIG